MRTIRPFIILFLLVIITSLFGLVWFLVRAEGDHVISVLPTQMPTASMPTQRPADTLASGSVEAGSTSVSQLPQTFTPAAQIETDPVTLTPTPHVSPTPTSATVEQASITLPASVASADSDESETATPNSTTVKGESNEAIDRRCPDPPRVKPEYARYSLADEAWPQPDESVAAGHFWLSRPYRGDGRFLINPDYPYGNDLNNRLLLHNGVDSAEPMGEPLLAVADGVVVVAQDDYRQLYGWRCDWYGHLVVLEIDQTWQGRPVFVLYGHVQEISVEAGQRVNRGEQLALVGFGGAATAPHLHLEVRIGANDFGATRNPMLWMDPGTRGVIVGRLIDPSGRPWQGVGLSLIGRSEDTSSGNTWSYLSDPQGIVAINPDERWAENFVFADVKPGRYDIYTKIQGREYFGAVEVQAGQVSTAEIVTEPYQPPTPAP